MPMVAQDIFSSLTAVLAGYFLALLQEHSGSIIHLHLPSLRAITGLLLNICTFLSTTTADCNHILGITLWRLSGAIFLTILQWRLPHPLHLPNTVVCTVLCPIRPLGHPVHINQC